MKAVYLTTKARYRTPLRSDTLWGLLTTAIGQVYGEEALLRTIEAAEAGMPVFTTTSAMPFVRDAAGERVHFFPRPLTTPFAPELREHSPKAAREDMRRLKQFKKVRWLPQSVFEAWIAGETSEAALFEQFVRGEAPRQPDGFGSEHTEHIAIDRLRGTTLEVDGRGQLFTRETYTLPPGGGLYFLVDGDLDLVEGALRYLEHFGFGGDNTIGAGSFTAEPAPFDLRQPASPTHFVTLSLYAPTGDELAVLKARRDDCWYELVIRRGRVGSHFVPTGDVWKRPVAAFTEGSTFPALPARPVGRLPVVKEVGDIRVRHSGMAFPVSARLRS